jgi:hypothetical protein
MEWPHNRNYYTTTPRRGTHFGTVAEIKGLSPKLFRKHKAQITAKQKQIKEIINSEYIPAKSDLKIVGLEGYYRWCLNNPAEPTYLGMTGSPNYESRYDYHEGWYRTSFEGPGGYYGDFTEEIWARSNWDTIVAMMTERYPQHFEVIDYHLCIWLPNISIPLTYDVVDYTRGEHPEIGIKWYDALNYVYEQVESLAEYPILDEDDVSRREYEAIAENANDSYDYNSWEKLICTLYPQICQVDPEKLQELETSYNRTGEWFDNIVPELEASGDIENHDLLSLLPKEEYGRTLIIRLLLESHSYNGEGGWIDEESLKRALEEEWGAIADNPPVEEKTLYAGTDHEYTYRAPVFPKPKSLREMLADYRREAYEAEILAAGQQRMELSDATT